MLALIFRIVSVIYHRLYDWGILPAKQLNAPCISVGNLCVGGSGKSPVTIALCKHLLSHGQKPAILARGYKSGLKRGEFAVFLQGKLAQMNVPMRELAADEARMQSLALPECPVILGSDRFQAHLWFQSLGQLQPSCYVLDDGFQHRRLKRNLDIVLLDQANPFDNHRFLPSGALREGESALKRAQVVLWTRAKHGEKKRINRIGLIEADVAFKTLWPMSIDGKMKFDPALHGPCAILCGIAAPKQFLLALKELGIKADKEILLKDHQKISAQELNQSLQKINSLIVTMKDYCRQPELYLDMGKPIFIAELEVFLAQETLDKILSISSLNQNHS